VRARPMAPTEGDMPTRWWCDKDSTPLLLWCVSVSEAMRKVIAGLRCTNSCLLTSSTMTTKSHHHNSKKRSASSQLPKKNAKKAKRDNDDTSTEMSAQQRKKLFVTHVQLAHKKVFPAQKLTEEQIQIVEALRKHENTTVALAANQRVGFVSVALECIHQMVSSYFKPQSGTFAIFITPNEYSAFAIHNCFEKLLESHTLKPTALGSLFLQHLDVELNKTKNEIASLAKRERGAVIVSPARNLPFFIRGKGASLIKIEKLKYVFVVDPLGFNTDEKKTDLSHSLNRLAKTGSKFNLAFLSERNLPLKPTQYLSSELFHSPVTSLAERLKSVHLEKIAQSPQALSSRPSLCYYHEVTHTELIPTALAMLKSTMNIPRPTKAILFTSSKIVLKFIEHALILMEIPIIGSSINRNTSVRVATHALEEYAQAKKGILLATDRFANGSHLFVDTDFFFFLDTPVDKENFAALGKLAGKTTAHKILLTPLQTHNSLTQHLSSVDKVGQLKMKQIDTHPTKKVCDAISTVATREVLLAQKAAQQFFKLRNSRAEKVFGDESDRFIISESDAAKNFSTDLPTKVVSEKKPEVPEKRKERESAQEGMESDSDMSSSSGSDE